MHEEEPGLLVEHVAVKCSHLDVAGVKSLNNRIDLVSCQNEVAGNRRLAVAARLKADPSCETHWTRRIYRHALHCDGITARNAELIDPAIGVALDAHDLVKLRSIKLD